jgi:hypothetical protein
MSNLGKPTIDVSADHVVILGIRIPRPPGIAPSQWIEFWTRAKQGPGG